MSIRVPEGKVVDVRRDGVPAVELQHRTLNADNLASLAVLKVRYGNNIVARVQLTQEARMSEGGKKWVEIMTERANRAPFGDHPNDGLVDFPSPGTARFMWNNSRFVIDDAARRYLELTPDTVDNANEVQGIRSTARFLAEEAVK